MAGTPCHPPAGQFIAAFAALIGMRFASRRSTQLAASIFLDVLNVFLFFLAIFSGEER